MGRAEYGKKYSVQSAVFPCGRNAWKKRRSRHGQIVPGGIVPDFQCAAETGGGIQKAFFRARRRQGLEQRREARSVMVGDIERKHIAAGEHQPDGIGRRGLVKVDEQTPVIGTVTTEKPFDPHPVEVSQEIVFDDDAAQIFRHILDAARLVGNGVTELVVDGAGYQMGEKR